MGTTTPRQRQWLLSLLVFACGLVLAWQWVRHAGQQEAERARNQADDLAADHAQSLQRGLERALSSTYALAALVRQGEGQVPAFEGVATEMLRFYPGIVALGISPGGVICCVVPHAGNEKSIGFDLFKNPQQNKEAFLARDTGRLTLAGPMHLVQGGMGVVGRLPVFLSNAQGQRTFWGFSYATLKFPEALEAARLGQLRERGYAYELWRTLPETGERQRIEAWSPEQLQDPVSRQLALPNGTWTLSVAPLEGWVHSPHVLTPWVVGVGLSALLAYLAWLLYAMRLRDMQLESLVARRTEEIFQAQQHLAATLEAIPDLLFEVGLDGRYYSTHAPRAELLLRPEAELAGRTVHETMPPEPAAQVIDALRQAHEKGWHSGTQILLPLDIGPRWFELSVARKAVDAGAPPRFVVISRDITANKEAEEKVRQLAHYDVLTGLPNRSLLADRCQFALGTAQRNGHTVALLFLDLDHFKNVNDSLGHRVGDALLRAVALRLRALLREQDTVSRLSGDEFVLVLPDTSAAGAVHVAKKLLAAANEPFDIESHELVVTPSIGIAMFPSDGADFDTLLRCADAAMYSAKQGGRNHFHFYTAEMQARTERALLLENALRRALERNQLQLHYQPQVLMSTGAIVGVEALLRWNHPELGAVSPAEFIPVAECSGLILPIGEWVLRTAAQQLREWMDAGHTLTMAVNLSLVQFRQADFPQRVQSILEQVRLPAHSLELELTEGVAMTDPDAAIAIVNQLHQSGVLLSIDDFGTGYSSLSHLKRFKVYKIKIDRSFVRDIETDPDDRAIVGTIISMADSLGMQTIAEGVETQGQWNFLQTQGCAQVQGYLVSKPLPVQQLQHVLEQGLPPVGNLPAPERPVLLHG